MQICFWSFTFGTFLAGFLLQRRYDESWHVPPPTAAMAKAPHYTNRVPSKSDGRCIQMRGQPFNLHDSHVHFGCRSFFGPSQPTLRTSRRFACLEGYDALMQICFWSFTFGTFLAGFLLQRRYDESWHVPPPTAAMAKAPHYTNRVPSKSDGRCIQMRGQPFNLHDYTTI